MDMPIWTDFLRIGDDTVDNSHQDMMTSLAAVDDAVRRSEFDHAARMVDALSDACSIHAQSEDELFAGQDHAFPHETLDDLIAALRAQVLHRQAERAQGTVAALRRALLSDIHADRAELARASAWHDVSRKWLCAVA